MGTTLIRLADGTLVEAEVPDDQMHQVGSDTAANVAATFDKIKPVLITVCKPIVDVWKELNKDMSIEQAEISLGLSFEGEGNLFVTKSKAGANLTVKLTLKPPKPAAAEYDE